MIDTINIIVTSAVAIVSALGGSSVLYFRQDRKNKELQNEISAISEWQELYKELKEENARLNEKIDELYGKIEYHRDEKTDLRNTILTNAKKISDLEISLVEMSQWKCEVRQCSKRRPPSPITMIDNE